MKKTGEILSQEISIHKKTLELCKRQVSLHNFGKLVFLSYVGTRPWLDSGKIDYDFRGVYLSKRDDSYKTISQVYINGFLIDIILTSLERFIHEISSGQIQTILALNSPVIFETKEFSKLKKWLNNNHVKQIFNDSKFSRIPQDPKSLLYFFLETGNTMSILEKKNVYTNLNTLNDKYLHLPFIGKILKEQNSPKGEYAISPIYQPAIQEAINSLAKKARKLYLESKLPEVFDYKRLASLQITKNIDATYWSTTGLTNQVPKK